MYCTFAVVICNSITKKLLEKSWQLSGVCEETSVIGSHSDAVTGKVTCLAKHFHGSRPPLQVSHSVNGSIAFPPSLRCFFLMAGSELGKCSSLQRIG